MAPSEPKIGQSRNTGATVSGSSATPAIINLSAGAGSCPVMMVRFGLPEIEGAAAISTIAVASVPSRPSARKTAASTSGSSN